MVNRLTAFLLFMLASLVAVIAIELQSGARSVSTLGASAATAEKNERALSEPLRRSPPPLASLSETTARPLFMESRRPTAEASAPADVTPVHSESGPKFSISAIVMTEDERTVLVNHPDTGALVRLRQGERIAGWTLDKVESDRAIFSKVGESKSVTLRTFDPPITRRAAPQAGSQTVPAPSANEAKLLPPRRPTRPESAQPIRQPGR